MDYLKQYETHEVQLQNESRVPKSAEKRGLFTTGTMKGKLVKKSKNVEENRRRATFLTTVGICQIGTLFSSID